MNRQFDLIAFDWDGTLFDSTAIIVRCIQEAVRDVGGTVPSRDAAAYVIGMGLMQALAHAAPDVPPALYPRLGERYRLHYMRHQDDLSLFPGVLAMLEALHSAELLGRFDGSRTADETAGKPHPLMLQELMAEFDVPPQRTLMIGDTTHDLQMAIHAGCASVGVSYGAHEPGAFHALQPRAVVHSVAELHEWLLLNG